MFVGRENELETLERAYDADVFQMVVVYGRRRVGKTTLLTHFAQDKPTLFFTAQQQTDADNLADFSVEIAQFFSAAGNKVRRLGWCSAVSRGAGSARTVPFRIRRVSLCCRG